MSESSKSYTVHMIANAHIDPVWLWPEEEGREVVLATCRAMVEMLRRHPEFTFVRSSAATYRWIEEDDPELFAEISRYIKEGRWEVVGGWWVQPDCNLPCGESFVRHALYGKRYFKEKFGVDVRVGYNVDSFGHCATLPQILKKCGIDYYVFFRPNPKEKELPTLLVGGAGRDQGLSMPSPTALWVRPERGGLQAEDPGGVQADGRRAQGCALFLRCGGPRGRTYRRTHPSGGGGGFLTRLPEGRLRKLGGFLRKG